MSSQPKNFRIIQVGKRPINHILLRRAVDDDGRDCVMIETWIENWYHSTKATFDDPGAVRFYIETFSVEAAERIMAIAKATCKVETASEPKE